MTYSDKKKRLINKVKRINTVNGYDITITDKVIHKSVYSTTFQSRFGIQSIQSVFQLIKFNDSKKGQTEKPIKDKDAIANIADILDNIDNHLPFKNNVKCKWARFIQTSKITKGLITMFFNNPTLVFIKEFLSYKNVDKMRALLIKLLYSKRIW